MAIGDTVSNRFVTYEDPYTGAVVERLTDPGTTCHHMYFYAHMTTADGSKLLYAPEIDGERQIFCMDLMTGDAVQLTEGRGVDDWSAEFTPDERGVIYHQDDAIWRLDLSTLERECVYRTPEGWDGRDISISRESSTLSLIEIQKDTLPVHIGGSSWDFFEKNCLARPRCRVRLIDADSDMVETLLDERCWLGHAQIRPGDPGTVLYCHEGPYDLIDARMWVIDRDERAPRCLRDQPDGLILTHEFWTPDGSRVAYVYREMDGQGREEIRTIDPDTLVESRIMPCQTFAHCNCDHAGRFFIGDAQGDTTPIHLQDARAAEARRRSGEVLNDFLYLIDVGHGAEIRMAYHGSSWSARWGTPQDAHPHPCFSEDDRHVIFATDQFGHPSICRIDLDGFLRQSGAAGK
ncbi:MAG: oligogalacturonate lyase family protein [Collinsella sp.]|nr:oligogalacturonate lyase family protein [Collinsella sp.]